jgi:hypothetical protein
MKMKGVDMDAIRDMPEPAEKQAWLRTVTILASMVIVLLLIMAGAGLFGQNVYDDFAPPKYVQESRAQDLISLALGIPLLAAALIAVQRGRAWGFPLWAGVLAYELYVYAIYAFGGVYNIFFLAYIAVASLSLYGIVGVLNGVDGEWFQQSVGEKMPRRWIGGFFLLITLIFAAIWIASVLETISTGTEDSGHLIFVIDLMIVLPAFVISAVKLFRRQVMGDVLAGTMLIKFDSLCIAIALGQLFRAMNGIAVESGLLSVFIPMGVIGLVFSWVYFRNLRQNS